MAGHRTTLKKSQKAFKSGHASKRSIKAASKGKVEKSDISGPKTDKVQTKSNRKNLAKQLKKNKIIKTLNQRALFANGRTERIITFIPLTSNLTAKDMVNQLLKDEGITVQEEICVKSLLIHRYKANLKVILPDMSSFTAVLDAAKVADFVVFGLSATEEVDPNFGEQIIRAVEYQGIASTYCMVPDVVSTFPKKKNLQEDIAKSLYSYFGHFFPDCQKLYMTENQSDSLNLLRNLCQKFPKSVRWRDARGFMIVDHISTAVKNNAQNDEGYLVVEGTVRGSGFCANNLVQLDDLGDYQVDRLERLAKNGDVSENIVADEEIRESLDELLPIEDEQMDEDIQEVDEEENGNGMEDPYDLVKRDVQETIHHHRKLPKGVSAYQAKWLLDDDINEMIEERGEASDTDDETRPEMPYRPEDQFEEGDLRRDHAQNKEMEMESDDGEENSQMETDLLPEEEARQLELFKKRAKEELEFPDEIELHPEEKAVDRLRKYRGVKSLSDCLWDYDEEDSSRPSEWLRYLRVKNYDATRKRIGQQYQKAVDVRAGEKCRMYITVSAGVLNQMRNPAVVPFVVYGLFAHEHKLAVCNFACQTWESYALPIKSKESIYVQYGSRRVAVQPLFSQPSHNPNNLSKFVRFLQVGSSAVATVVAPISFTTSPALFYKQTEDGKVQIMAQGTFMNSDYTRIIAKRSVLTGEVLKIHKTTVTIRYMFFHYEDVLAYQNVPLFSKMGRSGLIKESLGTHGYLKATFDAKLNAQDIVAMALYKRMWPRNATN
ncbi:hypothetical protein FOA43_004785 [Brettanomyces nanus]|uniref:Bms1-type G domain-containing protein n=1 Tax=Eeniella nana TaxID=13502 RepID=A0A875SCJ1_EENNA|nr:uncharacterized protein FOA43_004785 [Brettanomyces nanus]QPG77372.1 hypothetical protein FOA43_004785 [Brettanomyces nanus]